MAAAAATRRSAVTASRRPPSMTAGLNDPHVLREYALLADGERAR